MSKPVLYLAHPVGGDVTANVDRALRWLRWSHDNLVEFDVVMPWLAEVTVYDDANPWQREASIRRQANGVQRLDGVVVFGGFSEGVLFECRAALDALRPVLDLRRIGAEPPIGDWGLLQRDDWICTRSQLTVRLYRP